MKKFFGCCTKEMLNDVREHMLYLAPKWRKRKWNILLYRSRRETQPTYRMQPFVLVDHPLSTYNTDNTKVYFNTVLQQTVIVFSVPDCEIKHRLKLSSFPLRFHLTQQTDKPYLVRWCQNNIQFTDVALRYQLVTNIKTVSNSVFIKAYAKSCILFQIIVPFNFQVATDNSCALLLLAPLLQRQQDRFCFPQRRKEQQHRTIPEFIQSFSLQ